MRCGRLGAESLAEADVYRKAKAFCISSLSL